MPSPSAMLRQMRRSELGMWAALMRVDPWGEWRADLRAGTIASTLVNLKLRKGAKPYSALDFMPFEDKANAPDPAALSRQIKALLSPHIKKKGG